MRRPSMVAVAALAASSLLLVSARARASPLQMFGIGGDSPARAGTGAADTTGFEGVYLNPAGLAEVSSKRVTLGTLLGTFELEGIDRSVDDAIGLELGMAMPLPLGGAWRDRVGFAMGFYIPTRLLNRARAPMPGTPFFALLENRAQTVGLQAGLGVKLGERWSVGVSMLALAALRGRIHVSSDPSGRFTTTSEQQLVSDLAPIAGARWHATSTLTLASTLRLESSSGYDILVTNQLGDALPVTLPELRFAGVAQYDPLTVATEAAWRPTRAWLLTGQLAWEAWSRYPLPTENPVAGMPAQDPHGYRDVIVPRAGAAWTHRTPGGSELTLRGGYFFAWSPAPVQTGMQALVDNHRHVLTFGTGLGAPTAATPFYLDAWFQWHVLVPRANDRPGDEADVETSGAILVGGVTLGVDL